MRACALIPAYDAEQTIAEVVRDTIRAFPDRGAVIVVDDGSRDRTAALAREAGARVIAHRGNRGKGAALRTGMEAAYAAGFEVAVTVDADGQHPAREAARLVEVDPDPQALVLGIRDLLRDGAPRASQMSNRISNFFLSLFSGRPLADTQCGLRRYPLPLALDLRGRDDGYAFEAEIILRTIAAGARIVEAPVRVFYPPPEERITHFDSVRDPARIVVRVLKTLALTGGLRRAPAARRAPARAPAAHADPIAPPPP